MKNQDSTAMILFEQLDPEVRKAIGPKKIRAITGNLLVAEKTREYYQDWWARLKRHLQWKTENGFCAWHNTPSCMNRVHGDESMCSTCQKICDRYRRNAGKNPSTRALSPYSQWRAVTRMQEKAERNRQLGR